MPGLGTAADDWSRWVSENETDATPSDDYFIDRAIHEDHA